MRKSIIVLSKVDLLNKSAPAYAELIAAVEEGNAGASRFVYSPQEIVTLALRAERRLERSGLPQTDRLGFEATFHHAGPVAKAYKYSAAGRSVTLRRAKQGWVLAGIDEIKVFPAQGERTEYRATPRQIEEIQLRAVIDLSLVAA